MPQCRRSSALFAGHARRSAFINSHATTDDRRYLGFVEGTGSENLRLGGCVSVCVCAGVCVCVCLLSFFCLEGGGWALHLELRKCSQTVGTSCFCRAAQLRENEHKPVLGCLVLMLYVTGESKDLVSASVIRMEILYTANVAKWPNLLASSSVLFLTTRNHHSPAALMVYVADRKLGGLSFSNSGE